MPIKELSLPEQIDILKRLENEEEIYDKQLAYHKGDTFKLKHKFHINTELDPQRDMRNALVQKPTIKAIEKISDGINKILPESIIDELIKEIKPDLDSVKDEPKIIVDTDTSDNIKSAINEDIIKKNHFPSLSEIDSKEIESVIQEVSNYNRQVLGPKLASLSRAGLKNNDEYNNIKAEIGELKKYRSILEQKLENESFVGTGIRAKGSKNLIKFGKYYARVKDLDRNMLCIRRKNNSVVFDMKISEGVKKILFKKYEPQKYHYTDDDFKTLKEIVDKTGYESKKLSRIQNKTSGQSLFLSINDAKTRLLHCIGELKAGNNNNDIKNELISIADLLLKHQNISKEEYRNVCTFVNKSN